jgi:hypothetical protein
MLPEGYHNGATLAIQFSNGANTLVVGIKEFQVIMDELTISQKKFISNVIVNGTLDFMLSSLYKHRLECAPQNTKVLCSIPPLGRYNLQALRRGTRN